MQAQECGDDAALALANLANAVTSGLPARAPVRHEAPRPHGREKARVGKRGARAWGLCGRGEPQSARSSP